MNSNDILKADMLDILFERRNKLYGAYMLRKNYNNRLAISLALSLLFVLILFLLIRNTSGSENVSLFTPGEVVIKEYTMLDPVASQPEVQTAEEPVAQQVAQQEFTDRIEIREDVVRQEMPLMAAITRVGDQTIAGPSGDGDKPVVAGMGMMRDGLIRQPAIKRIAVNRAPEFPGGMEAWLAFLNKNLIVPAELNAGEKKTVMIRFEVGTDGAVTGFEVVQSGGTIYDTEVIRALKRMPKWKPAIQNDLPVSTSFTQPVTFVGLEN